MRDEHDERKREYKLQQLKEKSEELFDVGVTHDALWLFHNGEPVCPMSMFKEGADASLVIGMLRTYYIEDRK